MHYDSNLGTGLLNSEDTDSSLSRQSDEFVWTSDALSASNRLVGKAIADALHRRSCRNILDLGCGNGALSGMLAQAGFGVTGCDVSQSGLHYASGRYPNLSFFQQDLTSSLAENHCGRYDAVVSSEVVEHLLLPRRLIQNAVSALKPKGILVLTTPYHGYVKNLAIALLNGFDAHWHPLRDFGHVKFFSEQTIKQLVGECGLTVVEFRRLGRIPPLACSMMVMAEKRCDN